MDTATKKPELKLFRGTVIYKGKLVGLHNSIFIQASTIEKAEKFIRQRVRKHYKSRGLKDIEFNVFTTVSCEDEIKFFQANINKTASYNGLMN
jgi:hypothetical protein